jgi:hypothetical protein
LEESMTCRYCGLETGSGAGHQSQAECIQALSDEIDRAKRLVNHARDGTGDDQRPARDSEQTGAGSDHRERV